MNERSKRNQRVLLLQLRQVLLLVELSILVRLDRLGFVLDMECMIPDVPLLSIPVPIYLPSPTPSYRLFKPRAVPIPVPVFVPILIPVPKTAYKSISQYLQVSSLFQFLFPSEFD